MHSLQDYKQFKDSKKAHGSINDQLTTPLHLAANNSSVHAIELLVKEHDFDVNLLFNKKSFMIDLLDNSCYKDFSILQKIFELKIPSINSGVKLPLNQAIYRGNPMIIKLLIEKGKPHPYLRDYLGKNPLHVAALKMDTDTFETLIEIGFDPMMPDFEGNTFLHMFV